MGLLSGLFSNYVKKEDQDQARKELPRLMTEGLLLGGTGLGVLALIFEIAADAFSVAAYQTLLAIHGAGGNHDIAMLAFAALSVMLFFGIVPAYKAAAYLRPDTGGSGPLVESIGPQHLRKASWVGTSLFFMDAVLTIIISSISAADVIMLLLPELALYRILLAEIFAFFIMVWLVGLGPKRAVPLFLLGGGLFTIFTIFALGYVGVMAAINPDLAAQTPDIVHRLEASGVVEHVTEIVPVVGMTVFFGLLLKSMSSAMLGFSGYEMIPASGKHAARPKWKVINTSLTLAAVFLIGTGVLQLYAAQRWAIPATEGYSTLLIQYELIFGGGSTPLVIAGILLAVILLLAQGGGYVGGAAVAANAARLGRLPRFFENDRLGIAVIWGISAVLIPIIRTVVVVESYYAFGFVSAFIITSTTVFFVRKDVLEDADIAPDSGEAKSLKFAGLRGMIASYIMGIILITQKTEALLVIIPATILITLSQVLVARGGLRHDKEKQTAYDFRPGYIRRDHRTRQTLYDSGIQRAYDEARQRGIVALVEELIEDGEMLRFNVEPTRIKRLVGFLYGISSELWAYPEETEIGFEQDQHLPEPSSELEETFEMWYHAREEVLAAIEKYSHYGIYTFVDKYYQNWVNQNRDAAIVQRAMLKALFINDNLEEVWDEYQRFEFNRYPEEIWQFCRIRYQWAKDQWPNLSDRITTIWTMQDLGILTEKNHEEILARINARI